MAAASVFETETEDFITCGVCFLEYDENYRKPKFLPCAHTVCLTCLKSLCKDASVMCPMCRKVAKCPDGTPAQLPNNPYAIHMIKLNNNINFPNGLLRCRNWCIVCRQIEKEPEKCSGEGHFTVPLGPATLKEASEMQELWDNISELLDEALSKRQLFQDIHQKVLDTVKIFENGLKMKMKENESKLAELMMLLDSCQEVGPEDTVLTLKDNLILHQKSVEDELIQTSRLDVNYLEKLQVLIELRGPDNKPVPTFPLFEKGFHTHLSPENYKGMDNGLARGMSLLSYLIVSILRQKNVQLNLQPSSDNPVAANQKKKEDVAARLVAAQLALAHSSVPSVPISMTSIPSKPVPSVPVPSKPVPSVPAPLKPVPSVPAPLKPVPLVLVPSVPTRRDPSATPKRKPFRSVTITLMPPGSFDKRPVSSTIGDHRGKSVMMFVPQFNSSNSTFIMKVSKNQQPVGEIHVQPLPAFDASFMKQLGEFCYQKPVVFSKEVTTVQADHFATLRFENGQFQPAVPSSWSSTEARDPFDVGLVSSISAATGRVKCWELIFLLKPFDAKQMKRSSLFGRVVNGSSVVEALSRTARADKTNVCVSIEVV